jgi:cyclase
MELQERPRGYVGPNLDPTGLRFRVRRFGEGVYAFIASPPPRDNSGCVIGEDGALVIDAGINGETARKIQKMVQQITKQTDSLSRQHQLS